MHRPLRSKNRSINQKARMLNLAAAAVPVASGLCLLSAMADDARAADRTWINTVFASQLFSNANNWDGQATIPASGDTISFGPGVSGGATGTGPTIAAGTGSIDYSFSPSTIFFTNPNALTATVQPGSTFTLNNVTFNAPTLNASGLTINQTGTGALNLGSTSTWDVGGAGSAFSGGLTVGSLGGNFGVIKKGTRLLTFNSPGSTFTGGVTIQNGSVFNSSFSGNGDCIGTGPITFNNQTGVNTTFQLNAGITASFTNGIVNNQTVATNSAFLAVGSQTGFYTYSFSGPGSVGPNFTGASLALSASGGSSLATGSGVFSIAGDWSGYTASPTADAIIVQGGGAVVLNSQASIAPTNYVVGGFISGSTTEGSRLILGGTYTMNQKVSFTGNANTMRNGFGTRAASGITTLAGDSTGNALVVTDADGGNIFAQNAASTLAVTGIVSGGSRLKINEGYTFSSGSSGTTTGTNTLQTPVGTVTMSNTNSYSGGTDVANGVLLVNNLTGSGTGTGVVNVGLIGAASTAQAGVTANNSRVITGVTTATAQTLQIGQSITGTGIPANARVTGITLGNSTTNSTISIDQTTTAAAANVGFATTALTTTASLGGTGIISGATTVNAGSTLSPGVAGPGVLTIGGNVTLASTSNFAADIQGLTPGAGGYDQLSLTGATGSTTLTGANLITNFSTFTPSANGGDEAFIINNVNTNRTIVGTFSGLADNSLVTTYGGQSFYITYDADSTTGSLDGGNDVALYTVSTPEPGSVAAILVAGSIVGLRRRRRIIGNCLNAQ